MKVEPGNADQQKHTAASHEAKPGLGLGAPRRNMTIALDIDGKEWPDLSIRGRGPGPAERIRMHPGVSSSSNPGSSLFSKKLESRRGVDAGGFGGD